MSGNKIALSIFLVVVMGLNCGWKQREQKNYQTVTPLINNGIAVGCVRANRISPVLIEGEMIGIDGYSLLGYVRAYVKDGQWWTDITDTNGRLLSRLQGVNETLRGCF
jgi:hypothetical protein